VSIAVGGCGGAVRVPGHRVENQEQVGSILPDRAPDPPLDDKVGSLVACTDRRQCRGHPERSGRAGRRV